jgi:hypothetical protein
LGGDIDGEPPDALTGFSSEIGHRVKSLTFTTRFRKDERGNAYPGGRQPDANDP